MEMKKQVLSFNEFVNEAYKIINEAETFQDAKQKLSKLVNSTGVTALGSLESLLKANSTPNGKDDKLLTYAGERFNLLIGKLDGKGRKITDVTVALDQIGNTTDNIIDLIQGQVFVNKTITNGGIENTVILKDGKANLTDLLSTINSKNIQLKGGDLPFEYNSKSKTYEIKALQEGDRKGIFPGSGTDRQWVLTDLGTDGFVFKNQMGKEAVAFYVEPSNVQTTPDSLEKRKAIKKDAKNQIYCTLVTYLIKNTIPNGGNPTAIEKVDKVIKIVKGGDESLSIDIQDNGTLFERAKSVLKEEGKSNISNAILNQFTSVSSIEVIGGASKEGDAAFNKKLCQDRAKSVEAYLKTITSAAITVSAEANIQPAESTDDLKTWRKVTLKVTGNRVAQTSPKEEISYVVRNKQFKPDAVILAQVSFEFKIEVDEA